MSEKTPGNGKAAAVRILKNLVGGWNAESFEAYSADFTPSLVDHYNPAYFARLRKQSGRWESNDYLGCLKQGALQVHLWSSRFQNSANDVLFSLSLNANGRVAGLLKRAQGV